MPINISYLQSSFSSITRAVFRKENEPRTAILFSEHHLLQGEMLRINTGNISSGTRRSDIMKGLF